MSLRKGILIQGIKGTHFILADLFVEKVNDGSTSKGVHSWKNILPQECHTKQDLCTRHAVRPRI